MSISQGISTEHEKVLMFSQFAQKLPAWVKNIVMLDDGIRCREGVLKANEKFGLILTVIDPTTAPEQGKLKRQMNLDVLELSNLILQHHTKVESIQEIIKKIKEEIKRLKASDGVFSKSSDPKVLALQHLCSAISNPQHFYPTAKTLKDLINEWKNDKSLFRSREFKNPIPISVILHDDLRMFTLTSRESDLTPTEKFLEQLAKQYAAIPLSLGAKISHSTHHKINETCSFSSYASK